MKRSIIFCFLVLVFFEAPAQTAESVKINVLKEEIVIGKLVITKKTTVDEISKVLGKPERVEKFAGKDRKFIYDSKGIAFSTLPNNPKNIIEAMTITYSYDGDANVAKEKFKGTLTIDSYTATEKSTAQEISDKTDFDKLQCFGTMCMSDPKAKGIVTMMGLTDKQEILQIVFGFKQ